MQYPFTTQSQRKKKNTPYICNTLLFVLLLLLTIQSIAQPAVPKPVVKRFEPVNLPSLQKQYSNPQPQEDDFQRNTLPMGGTAAYIIQQTNQNAARIMGVTVPGQPSNQQQQRGELHEVEEENRKDVYELTIQHYQKYLNLLLQLNPDSFSISKAVYLCESVYYNNPPSYADFVKAIQQLANLIRQILKKEGLNAQNSDAVHYAIQKLYSQDNAITDNKTGKALLVKKISYDFDDFDGERDWTKMFVTKLLQSNSGQCHSLPLLYLCIAEQLHTKAYLSLAPEHSFIQYFDRKGIRRSFETTNGNLVSISWLMQSNAISSMAYKRGTYLDTLSSRRLFAQCLADFQMDYIKTNGYDNYSLQLSQKILTIDSSNINALMTNANYAVYKFSDMLNRYGNPKPEQLHQFPELEEAYNKMKEEQQKINATGYQDMPREQYISWLKSIDREKEKIKLTTRVK